MTRFEPLERLSVTAAMSTADDGDCALVDDRPEVWANRARIIEDCGFDPNRAVGAQQIHGIRVSVAGTHHAGNGLSRAGAFADTDGLATREASLPLTITIADCVPLFLVDPVAKVGALVHAGRVGTQQGIASAAVDVMTGLGGEPSRIVAVIGPSAGPCCYEVSEAMAEELASQGLTVRGRHVDLWATNCSMLEAAQLKPSAIHIDGRCTICEPGFHSHRRDANGKRNMALLVL